MYIIIFGQINNIVIVIVTFDNRCSAPELIKVQLVSHTSDVTNLCHRE